MALIVVIIGAYTRLSDAGLGCPDWPGCYGQLTAPHIKGWIEMVHRYIATILGMSIFAIFLMNCSKKSRKYKPKILSTFLLLIVILQGALGMWTVTELLHPVIVSIHLLGGFTITCLLYLLWVIETNNRYEIYKQHILKRHKLLVVAVFILLITQIFLGGWTSANYAALSCGNSFLTCLGQFWPENMDFKNAFFLGELGINYEFGTLENEARTAIQMIHRIGAVILSVAIIFLIFQLKSYRIIRNNLNIIAMLLTLQITLGISNVIFSLPILIASMHNIFALLLLISFIPILYKIFK